MGVLHFRQISGPHLIVVPKSTLDNWKREFQQWVPEIRTFVLKGFKDERTDLTQKFLLAGNFDVCIIYEMILLENCHFK